MRFLPLKLMLAALLAAAIAPASVSAATRTNADAQPISSCTTIDRPGAYTLTVDIAAPAGDCITIAAPEVMLDLGGHSISGEFAGAGVYILPSGQRAQVSNGTVEYFYVGVQSEAPAVLLTGLHVRHTSLAGIALVGSDYSTVAKNEARDSTSLGVYLQQTDYAAVVGNTITSRGSYGIVLQGSSHDVVTGNAVSGSTSAGIYLGCAIEGITYVGGCGPSAGDAIDQNVVIGSSLLGIALDLGSQGNEVMGNTVLGSDQYDLFAAGQECSLNSWSNNQFATANPSCLR